MDKQNKRISTPYDDLTYKIIGCAMAVHRNLAQATVKTHISEI